ncbi:MAG: hypothetical protein NTY77_10345 [Elusimicrobia bacterium]|nr:hypothetical protein [Elusimicrobiota bacterium]
MEAPLDLAEFDRICQALAHDLAQAREGLQEKDSPGSRRAYLRAFYALADGAVRWLQQEKMADILEELDAGGATAGPGRSPALQAMGRFLSQASGSPDGPGPQIPARRGQDGWEAFQRAMAIHNRSSRPKRLRDLDLSDPDVETIAAASRWFQGLVMPGLLALFQDIDSRMRQARGAP